VSATTDDSLALDLVVFYAGGSRFAVEARHVVSIRADAAGQPDHVLAPPGGSLTRVLDLVQGGALLVEEPVSACRLPAQAIFPLPALMSARMHRPEIKALGWDEGGAIIIADPAAFGHSR
jgi:hypothetical protein